VVLVLGIVFTVVPLALLVAGVATLGAVVTWPFRRALWPSRRKLLRWEYWEDAEEPWEEE